MLTRCCQLIQNPTSKKDESWPAASITSIISCRIICESYDDKGNAVVYEYAEENHGNVDRSQVNECNSPLEAIRAKPSERIVVKKQP
ncbi:MAG: SpvB/TcaC N-terminal domain-containing protein [Pyrinomonadaceae bacterium]